MRKVLYIFSVLTDADVALLARIGQRRRLNDGDILIREGEPSDSVIFVLEGEFQISAKGVGQITRLGVGEIVGEVSLVDSAPPSATVTAHGRCLALFVDKAVLLQNLTSDQAFGCRFYRALAIFLADRLRAMSRLPALGEGPTLEQAGILQDELDPGILQGLSSAGERFQRLVRVLTG